MEVLGKAALRDPQQLLPEGFWAAVSVWLEKPQVANKRLCGARLDGSQGEATPGTPWEALRSPELRHVLGPGDPQQLEVALRTLVPKSSPPAPATEMVLKVASVNLFQKAYCHRMSPTHSAFRNTMRLVPWHNAEFYSWHMKSLRYIVNGIVTFLPLEQTQEGKYKVKICNVYQIRLLHTQDKEWSISILLSSPENYVSDGILYPKTTWLGSELLSKLAKWSTEIMKREFKSTLSLISVARYSKIYQDLKEKYKKIVKVWPEVTNPEKFVYEDVAIATYLLILWEDERAERGLLKKQSFVDLGCGNGLLVHILSNEGHPGKGIDVRRRKIWDMYGLQTCLEENAVSPNNLYPEVDWLIGNHSDELTPWIPVIAARSSYSCRYFLLPCCFFDFHGKYNRRQSKKTQYREYIDYVTEVGHVCGFNVEEDCLRIPSTKRVCLIGKSRTYLATQEALLDEQRARYINGRQSLNKTASDKRDGLHQIDSFLVATDTTTLIEDEEVPQKTDVENVLMSGFLPRGKEQMRNCTSLPHDFVNKVVLKVVQLLLSGNKESPPGNTTTWNRGESLTLGEIAEHLDKTTLKTLKNEYGGLQTLLKNNHQVFEVLNGKVHIRDWREWKPPRKNKRHEQAKKRFPSRAFKTRLCWFHTHHPQGCPLVSEFCHYAHGTEELKAPLAVPKINNAQQSSVARLTCCTQMD